MKLMFWMGAKPNGSERTFNVGPDFIRTALLLLSTAVSLSFAAGTSISKARTVEPRLREVEQTVRAQKQEMADLRQVSQTNQAVVISRLDALSAQMSDVQRVLMARGR